MKKTSYPGSQWSKWDLHIHSNASDGDGTPEQIIQKAKEEGLSVIALTDHHTVKNVDKIKKLGQENNIKVISGVEFRTELGAKSVHMIGLFPDCYNGQELNQKALTELVLNQLGLSETAIIARGRECDESFNDEKAFKEGMHLVQVDFKEAAELIHNHGGLVSVHAGNKANSIEEIKHDGTGTSNVKDVVDSLGTLKSELMDGYIDICELGSLNDNNAEFYNNKFGKPAIVASDSHSLDDVGKLYTWIKADKNFEGLRQIIYEPELRVAIQENKPGNKADYQVIDSICMSGDDFGNQEIPFNQDLNVIIGGRSSGKSILLGCIAKLANYSGKIKLDNDDYNEYIDTIVKDMKLKWKDDTDGLLHKVEYFPQSYINQLAVDSKESIVLMEKILKGNERRREIFESFHNNNSTIMFEITNEIENYFKLQYKLEEIQEEEASIGDIRGVQKEIKKLKIEIQQVKDKAIFKISENDELKYQELKKEKETLYQSIEINDSALVRLSKIKSIILIKDIKTDLIGLPEEVKDTILSDYNRIIGSAQNSWIEAISNEEKRIKKESGDKKQRINDIESDKQFIAGEKYYKDNEVIRQMSTRLDEERKKEEQLKSIISQRDEINEQISKSKEAIIDKQKEYYELGIEFCEKIQLLKDELSINPVVEFSDNRMQTVVDSYFDARNQVSKRLVESEKTDNDSLIKELMEAFEAVMKDPSPLKVGKERKQVISELLSTNYYQILYNVEYQGDTLSSMSEGKKAFVILRLLLDFDDNKYPILIDQPEDDLDNRAIYNDLVAYIRKKKFERQILLVTHNPNVAVATDAEEIVVANQHGVHTENQKDIKFEYRTGAIENSYKSNDETTVLLSRGIREHVCDLLEGGDLAFKKRESKYGFR